MTETLFFDASSNHKSTLECTQTRNDVNTNERRTVEALSSGKKS